MNAEWINWGIIFVMLHILGTAIGAGAAFTGDFVFINRTKNKLLTKPDIEIFDSIGRFVWIGLVLLLISGVGLFFQRPEIFWHSEKFWAKMTIVGILTANGFAFLLFHRPLMAASVGKKFSANLPLVKKGNLIALSGAISVVSWLFAIGLGVLGRTPFSYWEFIIAYLVSILIAFICALVLTKKLLSS